MTSWIFEGPRLRLRVRLEPGGPEQVIE